MDSFLNAMIFKWRKKKEIRKFWVGTTPPSAISCIAVFWGWMFAILFCSRKKLKIIVKKLIFLISHWLVRLQIRSSYGGSWKSMGYEVVVAKFARKFLLFSQLCVHCLGSGYYCCNDILFGTDWRHVFGAVWNIYSGWNDGVSLP